MGKSNFHVFKFYLSFLEKDFYKSIAFFGQDSENNFSNAISAKEKKFYDLSLNNWNINKFPYPKDKKFDLIICTRCAYFSKNPLKTIKEFKSILKPGGKILIDWGLGDHWRFKNFKVGWKKYDEHEWAYKKENFLWSCIWDKSFEKDKNVLRFKESIKKFDYNINDLSDVLSNEVNSIINTKEVSNILEILDLRHMFLWPEAPQLYTCLLLGN